MPATFPCSPSFLECIEHHGSYAFEREPPPSLLLPLPPSLPPHPLPALPWALEFSAFLFNRTPTPRKPVSFNRLQALPQRILSPSPVPPSQKKTLDGSLDTSGGVSQEEDGGEDNGVEIPNHVLVMKERQKLGSSATMARGAFLFCLLDLCGALTKYRACFGG